MDWVFEHLQILFVVAVAVVAILQKLKKAASTARDGGPPAADQEQAERTRRIQEEIRRRIMERRGVGPTIPLPDSETSAEDPPFPAAPPMIEEVRPLVIPPPSETVVDTPATEEAQVSDSRRQEQILQQFRELQTAQAAGRDSTQAESISDSDRQQQAVQHFEEQQAAQAAGRDSAPVRNPVYLRSLDLRNPASLRRAIVLREILGPPVGLR